jgi:putative acetyltransferase
MNVIIRDETESDINAIVEVTKKAFETLAISNHTEEFIIKALREANALVISLVAEADGKVVGHIAFSAVTISDESAGWYGLGPVSVLPELQRQGIGKTLIHKGLSLLRALGAKGCVLVGDRATTNGSASKAPRIWSLTVFRNSTFLCCRPRRTSPMALSCFMKVSKQTADPYKALHLTRENGRLVSLKLSGISLPVRRAVDQLNS